MPEGSGVAVAPDKHRARNPAAHSPVDTRTVPLSTGETAGAPPLKRQHRPLGVFSRAEELLTGSVEAPPFGQPVEQGLPVETDLERGQSARDGRLAQPERPPSSTH
jgi:hypothetical protein